MDLRPIRNVGPQLEVGIGKRGNMNVGKINVGKQCRLLRLEKVDFVGSRFPNRNDFHGNERPVFHRSNTRR